MVGRLGGYHPPKTNMTMENTLFEDVFPIEHGDFQCHVSFQGCMFERFQEFRVGGIAMF